MNKRLTKKIPQAIGSVRAVIVFREMFANYGYKESMKQIQQIPEREKQPNLTPAVAQSYSQ